VAPNVSRVASIVALAVLALAWAGAFVVIARGGEMDEWDWRVIGTLWAALFCGSAALVALRFRIPYRAAAAAPVGALLFVALAIWSERLWQDRFETIAKVVVSVLAVTLCVLLVGSLRLQTSFADRRLTLVYLGASALIAVTTAYALILLWSWNAPFFGDGGGESENLADAAQRVLFALFSLSVLAYLATPLLARALPPERDGSPR
jgi:hypothetical protein